LPGFGRRRRLLDCGASASKSSDEQRSPRDRTRSPYVWVWNAAPPGPDPFGPTDELRSEAGKRRPHSRLRLLGLKNLPPLGTLSLVPRLRRLFLSYRSVFLTVKLDSTPGGKPVPPDEGACVNRCVGQWIRLLSGMCPVTPSVRRRQPTKPSPVSFRRQLVRGTGASLRGALRYAHSNSSP